MVGIFLGLGKEGTLAVLRAMDQHERILYTVYNVQMSTIVFPIWGFKGCIWVFANQ